MFERIMYLVMLTVYTALCGALLVFYDADAIAVAIMLSIIPALVLWRTESIQSNIVPIVIAVTLGVSLLLQVFAYLNGLWYEISPWEIRILGLVPLEALLATFAHILFLILCYEFWFDDRKTSHKEKHSLAGSLAVAGIFSALAVTYIYVFSGVFFTYPFALLILIGFIFFAIAVGLAHRTFLQVIKKAALFALAIYPASLLYEYVILSNELRFLANTNEYLYVIQMFGVSAPIEELLLILSIPFWVAVLYELYLDDAQ